MPSDTMWIEIKIIAPFSEADAIANFLIEQGANGIVEENQPQAISCSSVSHNVLLKAYINKNAAAKKHLS